MGRIRWIRVIACGLVAGLVIDVSGVVLKGIVLERRWSRRCLAKRLSTRQQRWP